MRVLGINAVLHDPAVALAVDGQIIAATEEEPFSTWELPEEAARWALSYGNVRADELDAIASLDTDGRPMVDSPRDALECFGSAPVVLAIGPFLLQRDAR